LPTEVGSNEKYRDQFAANAWAGGTRLLGVTSDDLLNIAHFVIAVRKEPLPSRVLTAALHMTVSRTGDRICRHPTALFVPEDIPSRNRAA
jgi:hypothetical protein